MWEQVFEKYNLHKLQDIPFINAGGCGYAAYAIYRAAQKEGLKPRIYFCGENYRSGFNVPSHVVVKIGDKLVDAYGEFRSHYPKNNHSILKLSRLLLYSQNWNTLFDKSYVKTIENITGFKIPRKGNNEKKKTSFYRVGNC